MSLETLRVFLDSELVGGPWLEDLKEASPQGKMFAKVDSSGTYVENERFLDAKLCVQLQDGFVHALTQVDLHRRMVLGQNYRAALPLLVELVPTDVRDGANDSWDYHWCILCAHRRLFCPSPSECMPSFIHIFLHYSCVYVAVSFRSRF